MNQNQYPQGEDIFKAILNNPKLLTKLNVTYKYDKDFLELFYIIWDDEIQNYIPYEMYEHLKNESLMHKYHNEHIKKYENWPKTLKK